MVAVTAYKTIARREGEWWVIEVEGVGATQAKRLDQVEHMARDLIAVMQDEPNPAIELDVEVHVDDTLDRMVADSEQKLREGQAMVAEARAEKERIMRALQDRKLSVRDIGRLVGVSPQRVSQVIGEGVRTGVRTYRAVKDAVKDGAAAAAADAANAAQRKSVVKVSRRTGTRDEAVAAAKDEYAARKGRRRTKAGT
jgi:hypothetical protein